MQPDSLVNAPRRWPGGVSFTLDIDHGGHTIFVPDSLICEQLRAGKSTLDRLHWVMSHLSELVEAAEMRVQNAPAVPQFVVLVAGDLKPA